MKKYEDKSYGTKPIISNVVASGRFPHDVNIIRALGNKDFTRSEYNPETYPALLVKIKINEKLVHITIYKNGKYIITGVKSEYELNRAHTKILSILTKNKLFKS